LDAEYWRRKAYVASFLEKHREPSKELEEEWLIMRIWRVILEMLGFIRMDQMRSDSSERCEY
jgi:hypothetical protein